jgi:hypothetical protein
MLAPDEDSEGLPGGALLGSMPKLSKYQSFANFQSMGGGMSNKRAASMGGGLNRLSSTASSTLSTSSKTTKWYTCTVGRKPSKAHYYVDDTMAVAGILRVCMVASLDAKREKQSNTQMNAKTLPARLSGGPRRMGIPTLEEVAFEDEPGSPALPNRPFGSTGFSGFVECVNEELMEEEGDEGGLEEGEL